MLTASTTRSARASLASVGYPHRYTRTPQVITGTDAYNVDTYGPGVVEINQPCRYRPAQTLQTPDGATVTIDEPSLAVPNTDPIKVNDLVSNITDPEGTVLLAGPSRVQTVLALAPFGSLLSKKVKLFLADVR